MARPARFVGKQLKHVQSLIKQYGLKGTLNILAAPLKAFGKPHKLGSLRDATIFPNPESVSMPTLGGIAEDMGLDLKRGRKNPIVGKAREKYVARLVRDYGSLDCVAMLSGDDRDKKLFPEPVSVSPPTVQKIARRHGVELHKGRVPLLKAA